MSNKYMLEKLKNLTVQTKPNIIEIEFFQKNKKKRKKKTTRDLQPLLPSKENAKENTEALPPLTGSIVEEKNSHPPLITRYAITPKNMEEMNAGLYKLEGMPKGKIYAWLQINKDIEAKGWGRKFKKDTILAWQKNDNSSGHDQQRSAFGFELEDIKKAGVLGVDNNGSIGEWNLRSGTFKDLCELTKPGAEVDVGLPLSAFEPANPKINSPTATRRMKRAIGLLAQSPSTPASPPLPTVATDTAPKEDERNCCCRIS